MRILLCNAVVYTSKRFVRADVLITDSHISAIAPDIVPPIGTYIFDCRGNFIFPGFVDVHTHLREPGFSYKETIRSGTLAAAHGGYTRIFAMPNLSPVPDCAENLGIELELIKNQAVINVSPYGAITKNEEGRELADMESMADYVPAFSDDGHWVADEELAREGMRRAKKLGKIYASHCEDVSESSGGCINLGKYSKEHDLPGISDYSEWGAVERDLALAEETGVSFHVCHVSTEMSLMHIRHAKRRGINVTCETAPHYLLLCEDDLSDLGSFKMNPPLRRASDRDALIAACADGTIDMIATDHAPHSAEEKSRGLLHSSMGVVGLECAFPLLYTYLVRNGRLTLARLVEMMCIAPSLRFGMGTGELEIGAAADLTVFDLDRKSVVDPEKFLSMGNSTPFAGRSIYGVCILTMCEGRIVFKEETI